MFFDIIDTLYNDFFCDIFSSAHFHFYITKSGSGKREEKNWWRTKKKNCKKELSHRKKKLNGS